MSIRALNLYYAREPALRSQVLATRLRATDVREAMRVARGRVFRRATGGTDFPDVMWDCPFADAAAHEHDMRARAASVQFEACRAVMRTLTRRFERVLYGIEFRGNYAVEKEGSTQIAQCWIQRIAPAAAENASPIDAIQRSRIHGQALVFQRMDEHSDLPFWIVEAPIDRREELAATIAAWTAARAQYEVATLDWERVG